MCACAAGLSRLNVCSAPASSCPAPTPRVKRNAESSYCAEGDIPKKAQRGLVGCTATPPAFASQCAYRTLCCDACASLALPTRCVLVCFVLLRLHTTCVHTTCVFKRAVCGSVEPQPNLVARVVWRHTWACARVGAHGMQRLCLVVLGSTCEFKRALPSREYDVRSTAQQPTSPT